MSASTTKQPAKEGIVMERHYFEAPHEPGRAVKVMEVCGDLGAQAKAHARAASEGPITPHTPLVLFDPLDLDPLNHEIGGSFMRPLSEGEAEGE